MKPFVTKSEQSNSHSAVGDQIARATAAHRQGRYAEAEALYRAALKAAPDLFDAVHRLGVLKLHQGQLDEALGLIGRAATLDPASASAQSNLGSVLLGLGRHAEALACYDAAIALEPEDADFQFNRGNALLETRRYVEALACFDRLLQKGFSEIDVLSKRAFALLKLRRLNEAIEAYDRLLAREPDREEAHNNRGNALSTAGRFEDALASYDAASRADPNNADVQVNRSRVLRSLKREEEAVQACTRALALVPGHLAAAKSLAALKRHDAAVDAFLVHLRTHPGDGEALVEGAAAASLCRTWEVGRRLRDEAIAACRRGAFVGPPFPMLALCDDPEAQRKAAEAYVERTLARAPAAPVRVPAALGARKKLRLGYLSADFRIHPISYLIPELIELHDRSRFEVYGFASGKYEASPPRLRLDRAFDAMIDAHPMSDEELQQAIRKLEIDILIDLGGYTADSRVLALAGRPAPVQLSYLGYPGSLGAPFIDYLIVDRFLVPDAAAAAACTEKMVYLPDCFQVNDSKRPVYPVPPTRAECDLPEDAFVFCGFNNNYKINEEVFEVWSRLLQAVPGSVLWLSVGGDEPQRHLRREAGARSIDPARLVFAKYANYPDHLARQPLADLFLDTWPYNAGTTASDALWMGLPVVTYSGRSIASRMAGSLLHAIHLPELVTTSWAEYEWQALRLANNPDEQRALRLRLAENRRTTPLFDTPRFVRHIERAFEEMVRIAAARLAPRDIDVAALSAAAS